MIELKPGAAFVVGQRELARMYGKSEWWARCLMREWWKEQQEGGPVRVFRRPWNRGHALFTTLPVLQATMPPARDMKLVRALERAERDLDFAHKKIDELARRVGHLERRSGR